MFQWAAGFAHRCQKRLRGQLEVSACLAPLARCRPDALSTVPVSSGGHLLYEYGQQLDAFYLVTGKISLAVRADGQVDMGDGGRERSLRERLLLRPCLRACCRLRCVDACKLPLHSCARLPSRSCGAGAGADRRPLRSARPSWCHKFPPCRHASAVVLPTAAARCWTAPCRSRRARTGSSRSLVAGAGLGTAHWRYQRYCSTDLLAVPLGA